MLKDSLYAKYIKEREGLELYETEFGYFTYKFVGEECFLANICVASEHRGQGHSGELIDALSELAKESGAKFISSNVDLRDPGASHTLLCALGLGFKVIKAEYGILAIVKKIGEE